MLDRVILHCDINNFYASVEILRNPNLVGKPVAVCGDPEKRHGIVLAKDNIAKSKGVKTGDVIWEAKRKCPNIIIVPPTYGSYTAYSKKIFSIYCQYTSQVESFGLDECWLDVTESISLYGNGYQIAFAIKERVKEELGLTISIGVSFTKIFAKLGSDLKKPDAISMISRENFKEIAWNLPIKELLYIGRATEEKLTKQNIQSIGDLAKLSKEFLSSMFGKNGEKLFCNANGIETEVVKHYQEAYMPDSIGNGTTTPQDITNLWDAMSVVYALTEIIAFRLRRYNYLAGGVSIHLRNNQLTSFSRQAKMISETDNADDIASQAISLLKKNYDFNSLPPLRTITIGTFSIVKEGGMYQPSFFDEEKTNQKSVLDKSIDSLREKYGYNVMKRAINIGTIFTCDSKEIEDDFLPFGKNNKEV